MGRRAALLGAGMLAASVVLVVEVHIAKTDAALLGATTVAMAVLGRAYLDPGGVRRWEAAAFWLAMGAGVLLKGPITPMVAGLAVLALVGADRQAGWLRGLRAGWGVPLMLAVVVPWFVAIGVATHGAFFSDAVGGDLGRKLTSGDDAHWGPPGLHLLLLPVLLFPSTAALPAGIAAAWLTRREAAARFLLAWVVPAWLVFEAAPTKLPHYPLPLYPAVCLLLAHGVVAGVRVGAGGGWALGWRGWWRWHWRPGRWRRRGFSGRCVAWRSGGAGGRAGRVVRRTGRMRAGGGCGGGGRGGGAVCGGAGVRVAAAVAGMDRAAGGCGIAGRAAGCGRFCGAEPDVPGGDGDAVAVGRGGGGGAGERAVDGAAGRRA